MTNPTPNPHRERDEAAEAYVREGDCEVMDTYMAHERTFLAGWDAALANDPCVRALVEALENIRWSWENDAGRQCDNIAHEALRVYRERTTPEGTGE